MATLVHRVPGKWVGHAVLSATFRHPAVLAKAATVMDHATGGRFILGLGAGWHEGEHLPFGIPMPPMPERFDRFESAVHVLRALWSDAAARPPGVTRPDPFYPLAEATNELAFMVRLCPAAVHAEGAGPFTSRGFDLLQRCPPVHLRLALPQQIQVGTVQHGDMH